MTGLATSAPIVLAALRGTRTPVAGGLGGALATGFVLAVATALIAGAVFTIVTLKTTRGEWFVRRGFDGSIDMQRTSKWRMNIGMLFLALAGVVGIIGYLKISLEVLVAAQIVYLASAGFGVIILAVMGGALIVSEQLRADEGRIHELESALATIGDRLGSSVSEPPRLLDRSEG